MPAETAIATKKRLYEKALDSFTSSSQVSSSTPESVTSAKRPATAAAAFDEARERAAKRLRHSSSSSSLPHKVFPSPTSSARKTDSSSKEPPSYSPWSHEAFLARLKTFSSVSLWHPKPESIGEVEWAKRGWMCTDVNTVRCKGGCEKRVVVSLESLPKRAPTDEQEDEEDAEKDGDDEDAFEQAMAERYKEMIINGHAENCLWRKGGCKDDIYHLQVVRPAVWQPDLRKRFQSLLSIRNAVKKVEVKHAEITNLASSPPERLLKDLPFDTLGELSDRDSTTPPAKALDVALHGWRGSTDSGTDLLHCDACFQRIGLWMYQPDYRPAHSASDDELLEEPSTLDLVELHREHCPWRNPASQKSSGTLSGLNACEILQRVVSTYAREYKRRSDEQAGVTQDDVDEVDSVEAPMYSKEEVAAQDKERESRLKKLKSLFSIKRRSKTVLPKA